MSQSRKIIVPVDFSPYSHAAALHACQLARAAKASVHLLHALRPPVVMAHEFAFPSDYWTLLRQSAEKQMNDLRSSLRSEGVTITHDLVNVEAVAAICIASNDEDSELIVMGTHGYTGWKHAFLGSVTERTLRSVSTPLLAVKSNDADAKPEPVRKILVATDFSSHAEAAAQVALTWAERLEAVIELIHVVPEPANLLAAYSVPGGADLLHQIQDSASEKLADLEGRLEAQGARVTSQIGHGDASQALAEAAQRDQAQIIAIGTRGNTGLKHVFLGSVAERVLRLARCSVLVAHDAMRTAH